MQDKLKRLLDAGIDEDSIVATLGVTHIWVRRHSAINNNVTPGLQREIRSITDMSLKDMQEAYRLSNEALHKALYSYMPTQQHSYEELLAYHLAHDDTQEHFALSNKDYDEFISSIEGKQTTLAQRISIELAKGKTYREVAKTLGCSKSRVAQVCQEVRQQQNVLPWPEVCKYAREHGVTSAAALYKCTRGAIYYHLENNRCEAT